MMGTRVIPLAFGQWNCLRPGNLEQHGGETFHLRHSCSNARGVQCFNLWHSHCTRYSRPSRSWMSKPCWMLDAELDGISRHLPFGKDQVSTAVVEVYRFTTDGVWTTNSTTSALPCCEPANLSVETRQSLMEVFEQRLFLRALFWQIDRWDRLRRCRNDLTTTGTRRVDIVRLHSAPFLASPTQVFNEMREEVLAKDFLESQLSLRIVTID